MAPVIPRKHLRAACAAVLILTISISASLLLTRPPSPLAAVDLLAQAIAVWFQPIAGQADATEIVVVGITESTLARLPYRSPIDRGFLANLVESLEAAKVREIGLDIVFDRPTESAKDARLRAVLEAASMPIVVASVAPDTQLAPAQRNDLTRFLDGLTIGDANLARDRFDDVVRTHVPFHPMTGRPSFPVALAQALNVAVPTNPFPVQWQGGSAAAPIYPADAVAALPSSWLAGKVVLIGSLVPGTDEHRSVFSAFGPPVFGVQIHAVVLQQLLAHRAVPRSALPKAEIVATACLAAIGLSICLMASGLLAGAVCMGVALVSIATLLTISVTSGVWQPITSPLLGLALAGGATRAWRGRHERRDRRALRALFSRFVSEPVVAEIMKARDLLMSGGRPKPLQMTATVLYADIAGFTTICEGMAPEPLIAWLDSYIDAMSDVIMTHNGLLLRFIGDGILAVFGVPIPRQDEEAVSADARNAARCALEMEAAMQRLNAAWAVTGLPQGGLRIGLHTGELVAGSLGTGARMEFCLLGDTANVGARLEQLGKSFADDKRDYCTIVVGGPTWARLGSAFPGRKLGEFPLRGRSHPMTAYRIDSNACSANL